MSEGQSRRTSTLDSFVMLMLSLAAFVSAVHSPRLNMLHCNIKFKRS